MDLVTELLEEIVTTSIALNRAINDTVENDVDRFELLNKANAIDYEVHELRKHLERLKSH